MFRNFTLSVACCMGLLMPGDFKVAHINEVPLYQTYNMNVTCLIISLLSIGQQGIATWSTHLDVGVGVRSKVSRGCGSPFH